VPNAGLAGVELPAAFSKDANTGEKKACGIKFIGTI